MHFHQLNVSNVESLTPLSKKISFEIPSNLQSEFQFQSGQYVTLELNIEGNKIKRSYSICSPRSHRNEISVGVKEIADGFGSKFINQNIKKGDIISVSSPEGSFIFPKLADEIQYIFVAGGSGITPILSMIHEIMSTSNAKAYLKYSTLTQEETMFYSELSALQAQYPNLSIDFLFTNGENLLNETNLAEWIRSCQASNPEVFTCGPGGIITATEKACEIAGIDKSKFHREYFTAKSDAEKVEASVGHSNDAPLQAGESAEVEIVYEGRKLSYSCKYNETILDAALNAGGDPPYSCLVAACSTCRAMVKSGNIHMKDRDALSDKDIEKGFVLTCQAQPRSQKVVLDYDV